MKAPHRGTICLFLAKTVKNSKISHFKQVFCKKSAKSGLKFAKTAKSTTFYQLWDMQTSPRFFTLMSRASDINSNRWTIDCQSGIANDFMRIKKTLGGILYANQKNAGQYKFLFIRCAKTTCDIPATYIILFYMCGRLFKGDTESGLQKHNRLFKAVFS